MNFDANQTKILSSNMEDYLEAIYVLEQENKIVRVKDISDSLGVRKSSVNYAINVLVDNKLVLHQKYENVRLTEYGRDYAKFIQKAHNALFKFLTAILKIDKKIAEEEACKIEHSVSKVTLDKLIEFVDSLGYKI